MGLKLASLVSGGKDSIMALMIAVAQGHDVVVLGHLANPKANAETDSYMYQSVGSSLVQEALADAIGLPMISRTLQGTSIVTDADYHVNDQDEVEDLFQLLKTAKEEYGIQGITTGAILSSYQRIRVEHVCNRLGLVSLAYCWHIDQQLLLDLMIDVGLEAILVKVAAMGLSNEDLGKTLGEMKSKLGVLNRLYDVHVAGEGGEYETLTLDSPVFKKRLVINGCNTVFHSDDAFAPVAYLDIKEWELVDKDFKTGNLIQRMGQDIVQKINSTLSNQQYNSEYVHPHIIGETENHQYIFIPGISLNTLGLQDSVSIQEEIKIVMDHLKLLLSEDGLSFESVVLVHVFVSDMNLFFEMNQVYSSYFGINPPARVTVQADLPRNANVQIDLIASKSAKQTLHVQSISFWAAANIGPYAQAAAVGNVVFIAGQIGLVPNTMELSESLNDQIATSLFNLQAINREMRSSPFGAVCYITDSEAYSQVYSEWNDRSLLLTVSCSGLPRSALVEWQTLSLENLRVSDINTQEIGSDGNSQYVWKFRIASVDNFSVAKGTFSCENEDSLSSGLESFVESLNCLRCSIIRIFYSPGTDLDIAFSIFSKKCSYNLSWIPVTWIEGNSQLGIIAYGLQ